MFRVYGNILGDLGSKSSAVSDSLSNSGKVTFSLWSAGKDTVMDIFLQSSSLSLSV